MIGLTQLTQQNLKVHGSSRSKMSNSSRLSPNMLSTPRLATIHSLTNKEWQSQQLSTQDIVDSLFGAYVSSPSSDDSSKFTQVIQRQLTFYNGPNPFVKVLPLTYYEKFKIILSIITGIIFIKIIAIILILIIAYIFSLFVTLFRSKKQNANNIKDDCGLSWWRKPFWYGIRGLCRIYLFFAGFFWLQIDNIDIDYSEIVSSRESSTSGGSGSGSNSSSTRRRLILKNTREPKSKVRARDNSKSKQNAKKENKNKDKNKKKDKATNSKTETLNNNDTDTEIEATEKAGLKVTTTANANNNNNNNGNTNDKQNNKQNENNETNDRIKRRKGNFPRIIVSNHVSAFDAPIMFWLFGMLNLNQMRYLCLPCHFFVCKLVACFDIFFFAKFLVFPLSLIHVLLRRQVLREYIECTFCLCGFKYRRC